MNVVEVSNQRYLKFPPLSPLLRLPEGQQVGQARGEAEIEEEVYG
jgi:hypothetical protein